MCDVLHSDDYACAMYHEHYVKDGMEATASKASVLSVSTAVVPSGTPHENDEKCSPNDKSARMRCPLCGFVRLTTSPVLVVDADGVAVPLNAYDAQ